MNRKRERWDQAAKRKTIIYTDQHGREWGGTKDVFADAPIGTLLPLNFTPVKYRGQELLPPEKYQRFDDARPGQLVIDYVSWEADLAEAHRLWDEEFAKYAQAMYGDRAMEALERPTPAMMTMVGKRPMPVELVQAQAEGNRWILGLDPKRPTWADDFFIEETPAAATRRFLNADDEQTSQELAAVGASARRGAKGRFVSAEEE